MGWKDDEDMLDLELDGYEDECEEDEDLEGLTKRDIFDEEDDMDDEDEAGEEDGEVVYPDEDIDEDDDEVEELEF